MSAEAWAEAEGTGAEWQPAGAPADGGTGVGRLPAGAPVNGGAGMERQLAGEPVDGGAGAERQGPVVAEDAGVGNPSAVLPKAESVNANQSAGESDVADVDVNQSAAST